MQRDTVYPRGDATHRNAEACTLLPNLIGISDINTYSITVGGRACMTSGIYVTVTQLQKPFSERTERTDRCQVKSKGGRNVFFFSEWKTCPK